MLFLFFSWIPKKDQRSTSLAATKHIGRRVAKGTNVLPRNFILPFPSCEPGGIFDSWPEIKAQIAGRSELLFVGLGSTRGGRLQGEQVPLLI
jgi:hypothetical protein